MLTEDPNLILTLITDRQAPGDALELPHNRDRYVLPVVSNEVESREVTPYLEPEENSNSPKKKIQRLHLSFDLPPKEIRHGFSFGTDKNCDILLAESRGRAYISKFHFYITFDDNGQLVLIDESTNGMAVSYDGWGGEKVRHHFKWIMFSGRHIQIHLPKDFTLDIILAKSETCKSEYQANLMSYLEDRRIAISDRDNLPLSKLEIHSQYTTELPTELQTPRKAPIYLPGKILGQGAFGTVRLVTNVSTADVYAAKQFIGEFTKEVEIMKRVAHKHIVRFVNFDDGPPSQLIMEYLPLGNLADQHHRSPINRSESQQVLFQSLDALQYLHSLHIAHRDIKPENILLQGRDSLFHVKLADFGLSVDTSFLKTFCGTPYYLAPEVLVVKRGREKYPEEHDNKGYDRKIDIWSLGVVVLELVDSLPDSLPDITPTSPDWYRHISDAASHLTISQPDELIFPLLKRMLQIPPRERPTAIDCFREVCRIGLDIGLARNGSIEPNIEDNNTNRGDFSGPIHDGGLLQSEISTPHHGEIGSSRRLKWHRSFSESIGRRTKRPRDKTCDKIVQMLSDLHEQGILSENDNEDVVDMLHIEFSRLKINNVEIKRITANEVIINATCVDSSRDKIELARITPSGSIRNPLDLVLHIISIRR